MRRITPRTCLWPLAISLSLTFALSIGLTFRSNHHCYAGTCGEWLFPLQARLHVVVWYCWLGLSVTLLAIRAFQPKLKKILGKPLLERKLPWIGKQLSGSGLLIVIWIVGLYGALIGIWWGRLNSYFTDRGVEGGVFAGNKRLAAIALTGHLCDVTMGMAILPISRHSALASFFKISVATTLTFHMFTAYTLFTLVSIHGLLYVSWIPAFNALSTGLRRVYPVLNPTYLYNETWPGNTSALGIWRASLIFTGIVASGIFLLIFITTLPAIRNKHFNLFYFTHLLGIVAVVVICLHASTMFYCTAPGLSMWLLDWLMRLYELWAPLDARINALGKGWYQITAPLPRRRLKGCACTSPLAHFYIHHSDSSLRELHPFTTMTHLASQNSITDATEEDIDIQFLFRKRGIAPTPTPDEIERNPNVTVPIVKKEAEIGTAEGEAKRGFAPAVFGLLRRLKRGSKPKDRVQWTARLASLSEELKGGNLLQLQSQTETYESSVRSGYMEATAVATAKAKANGVPVSLRLEGPYFTPADPAAYETVVCLVAGTGVSGALAIVGAFKEMERRSLEVGIGGGVGEVGRECDDACQRARGQTGGEAREGCVASHGGVGKERVWRRCIVIWSVREDDYIALEGLQNIPATPNLDIRIHLTGKGRPRLSAHRVLEEIVSENGNETTVSTRRSSTISEVMRIGSAIGEIARISGGGSENERRSSNGKEKEGRAKEKRGRTWVYISGPNAFIAAGEAACKKVQGRGVEWYGARWDI